MGMVRTYVEEIDFIATLIFYNLFSAFNQVSYTTGENDSHS